MQRTGRCDTSYEMVVRSAVHLRGLPYRVDHPLSILSRGLGADARVLVCT